MPKMFVPYTLIETIFSIGNEIPLAKYHKQRLAQSLRELGIKDHSLYSLKALDYVFQTIMATKYQYSRARLKCHIVEAEGVKFDLEIQPISTDIIQTYQKPVCLCYFTDEQKSESAWQNLKSDDRDIYDKAMTQAVGRGFDDALVTNTQGNIIETTRSNIWWKKKKEVFTVPLSDGPVSGVFMAYILDSGYVVKFQSLKLDELLASEEVVITNALRGVQSVHRIMDYRFDTGSLYKKLKSLEYSVFGKR